MSCISSTAHSSRSSITHLVRIVASQIAERRDGVRTLRLHSGERRGARPSELRRTVLAHRSADLAARNECKGAL